ncbi:hypothetical protein L9F63_021312, partial [Diploptera punctata]
DNDEVESVFIAPPNSNVLTENVTRSCAFFELVRIEWHIQPSLLGAIYAVVTVKQSNQRYTNTSIYPPK